MSREIKFRAWYAGDKYQKPLMSTDFRIDAGNGHIEDGNYDEPIIYGRDMVPMQYTGLKDKNGKEIYEGDVIIPGSEFNNKGQRAPRKNYRYKAVEFSSSQYRQGFNIGAANDGNCEVIGNIYENPELVNDDEPRVVPDESI